MRPVLRVRHTGRDHSDLIIRVLEIQAFTPPKPPKVLVAIPDKLRAFHPLIQATQALAPKADNRWIDTRAMCGVVHVRVGAATT